MIDQLQLSASLELPKSHNIQSNSNHEHPTMLQLTQSQKRKKDHKTWSQSYSFTVHSINAAFYSIESARLPNFTISHHTT
uniref:Uncharacterized protein n=1 Tax=Arundo donax TaxID=35708 RepID=A0A0A8Z2L2_ARUDO